MTALAPGPTRDTVRTMNEQTAVACRGLTKRFGDVVAIADVSLSVHRGEVLVLLGPSGCGKTTFLRLLAGFDDPDGGTIHLGSDPVAGAGATVPPERRRVGFVFQDYALFPHLSVAANVAFGVRGRRQRVAEVLSMVGLTAHADRYPHELSGGEKQRVALARALAPEPQIILLDEPFSNLDADLRARVRTEVGAILRAAGATAIFVTHDQEEAFDIADRIAVMRAGRIEQLGRSEEIYHTPATRFVADFVGEAEFFPGEIRDRRLTCELGSFPLGETPIEPGPCELMVRPEDVLLGTPGDGGTEVVARRFRGPIVLTDVRLPSGRTVTAAHSSQVRFSLGDRVAAGFRPDHLVVFRGDERVAWIPARDHTGTD